MTGETRCREGSLDTVPEILVTYMVIDGQVYDASRNGCL